MLKMSDNVIEYQFTYLYDKSDQSLVSLTDFKLPIGSINYSIDFH